MHFDHKCKFEKRIDFVKNNFIIIYNQNLDCVVFYDALDRRAFSIIEILGRKIEHKETQTSLNVWPNDL